MNLDSKGGYRLALLVAGFVGAGVVYGVGELVRHVL
jgi:hypothetical protein